MSTVSGPLVEPTIQCIPETASPADEDSEFAELAGSDNITANIDRGIGLEELADWCESNNVPRDIALDLMKRAVDSEESFISY